MLTGTERVGGNYLRSRSRLFFISVITQAIKIGVKQIIKPIGMAPMLQNLSIQRPPSATLPPKSKVRP